MALSASMLAESILHEPRKRTPSSSSAARAKSETRGSNRASGRSSMSTSVTSFPAASVAAVRRRSDRRRPRSSVREEPRDAGGADRGRRRRCSPRSLEPGTAVFGQRGRRPDEGRRSDSSWPPSTERRTMSRRRSRSHAVITPSTAPMPRSTSRAVSARSGTRPVRSARRRRAGDHAAGPDRSTQRAHSGRRGGPTGIPGDVIANDDDELAHVTDVSASGGRTRRCPRRRPGKPQRLQGQAPDPAKGACGQPVSELCVSPMRSQLSGQPRRDGLSAGARPMQPTGKDHPCCCRK